MKFDQLLKIYWSKGFFINNTLTPYNINIKQFKNLFLGLNRYLVIKLIKRFELSNFFFNLDYIFDDLSLNKKKTINMYLASILNVNFDIFLLNKYNLIRFYLIKSYRGKSYSLHKPVRGQRTWSNAENPKKLNNKLNRFLIDMKIKYKKYLKIDISKNKKFLKLKKRKTKFRFKNEKKKAMSWF